MNLGDKKQAPLPLPDKKIPVSIMIIGTFELAASLLALIFLVLVGRLDGGGIALLVLVVIYGLLGAGLWAIQEWARFANVVLHILSLPFILYTIPFWGGRYPWQPPLQLLISISIIVALTRPGIRHKFQTVVPRQKKEQ